LKSVSKITLVLPELKLYFSSRTSSSIVTILIELSGPNVWMFRNDSEYLKKWALYVFLREKFIILENIHMDISRQKPSSHSTVSLVGISDCDCNKYKGEERSPITT